MTINNFTDEDCVALVTTNYRYIFIGYHVGEKSQVPHLHVVLIYKSTKRFTAMKSEFPRANIQRLKKRKNAENYIVKGGQACYIDGEPPRQGKRTDLERVRDELKGGADMRTVLDIARSVQSVRFAEKYLTYREIPRGFKTITFWFHGSTGTGKSRVASALASYLGEDTWTSSSNLKWFDGYDAHECAIFDDFREDDMKFTKLLRLTDRYEFRVEIKGGYRQFVSRYLFITCPYPLDDMDESGQLERRVISWNFDLKITESI